MIAAASVISAISTALQVANALIQAGQDAAPVATLLYNTFVDKKAVTQEDLDEFAAETDRLGAELMQAIPPEQGG